MPSNRILAQLLELTSNATNAFTAALFVADPWQKVLTLKASQTLSGNLDEKAKIPYGEGPIGWVAENEKPFLEEHFKNGSASLKMYTKREDLKSFLAVPVTGNGLAGVLAVDSKESYCFSIRSQKLVAGFAQQIAWQLAEEKKATRPTSGTSFPYLDFIKYSRFIIEALTPAAMAERLIRIPPSILRCDAKAVVWLEKSNGPGRIVYRQGWGSDLGDREILAGTGIAGACVRDGTPILSRNLKKCQTVLFWEKERLEGFTTALSIPIRFRDHSLAVLVFAAKEPDALTIADLERMNMVGTMAAPALFYAREKRKWDFDKNLDPITHIPNHRYLVKCREQIEKTVFSGHKRIFILTVHLKDLPGLYETHGVAAGDQLLREIVSMLAKSISPPKFLFKYSETSFLALIMRSRRDAIKNIEARLRRIFDERPFYVEGQPIMVEAELGVSKFPEEGRNLGALACLSRARASQHPKADHVFKSI